MISAEVDDGPGLDEVVGGVQTSLQTCEWRGRGDGVARRPRDARRDGVDGQATDEAYLPLVDAVGRILA